MKFATTIRKLRAVLEAARIAGIVLAGAAVAALIIIIAEKAIPQAAHDAVHHEHKGAW